MANEVLMFILSTYPTLSYKKQWSMEKIQKDNVHMAYTLKQYPEQQTKV